MCSQFELGKSYSREEIHDALGGSLEDYLPRSMGRVVCACLTREANPDAPHVVLPGAGPNMMAAADQLSQQDDPFPVFIKKRAKEWVYVGMFERIGEKRSPKYVVPHARKTKRSDITRVIYFREVG